LFGTPRPKQLSLAVDDRFKLVDSLVDKPPYLNLSDVTATQRTLCAELIWETQRLALLPPSAAGADALVLRLVDYINIWVS